MDEFERVIDHLRRQREILDRHAEQPSGAQEILERIAALNERMNRTKPGQVDPARKKEE
jgi:hypothetical protein